MILGAAQRLHTLPVLGRGLIDVTRDGSGSDEGDADDVRMTQQRVHRVLAAMYDVHHAFWKARLLEQLDDAEL